MAEDESKSRLKTTALVGGSGITGGVLLTLLLSGGVTDFFENSRKVEDRLSSVEGDVRVMKETVTTRLATMDSNIVKLTEAVEKAGEKRYTRDDAAEDKARVQTDLDRHEELIDRILQWQDKSRDWHEKVAVDLNTLKLKTGLKVAP